VEAYGFYTRGRQYYYLYHKQDNEHAIELFMKALKLDPHYALAYAGLGDCYGQRAIKFGFGGEWIDPELRRGRRRFRSIRISPKDIRRRGCVTERKATSHARLKRI